MDSYLVQLVRIIPYWVLGIAFGAVLKTFHKNNIHELASQASACKSSIFMITVSAVLGALSPITLFAVIPILYALDIEDNHKLQAALTAFITSSILISPNIFIFTLGLGLDVAVIRLFSAIMAGVFMGLVVDIISSDDAAFLELDAKEKQHQRVKPFEDSDSKSRLLMRNFVGAFKKTGIHLLIGITLSYTLYAFIPSSFWEITLTNNNVAVPVSAGLSTFLYHCGGGSIPILLGLMREGLSTGAAITFMLVGPLTKMTNLTALKSLMSMKRMLIYCSILMIYMLSVGWLLG